MRIRVAFSVPASLALVAAVTAGCSSAPLDERAAQGEGQALVLSTGGGGGSGTVGSTGLGGGISVNSHCKLPDLKSSLYGPIDCYSHVQGYEVRFGPGTMACPWIYVPQKEAYWAPYSATVGQGGYEDVSVPAWTANDYGRVCVYPYTSLYTSPYTAALAIDEETALAGAFCQALEAQGEAFSSMTYVLPKYGPDGPACGNASSGANRSPAGLPLPDTFSQAFQFDTDVCNASPTVVINGVPYVTTPNYHGPCDTCLR